MISNGLFATNMRLPDIVYANKALRYCILKSAWKQNWPSMYLNMLPVINGAVVGDFIEW